MPRTDATSTTASAASSTGCVSPAGDAVPRLPPTVPRLRICGDPTVRLAMARAGQPVTQFGDDPGVRDAGADPQHRRPTVPCSASSGTPVRSSSAAGRRWSKLSSTITSVPPAIGTASGCSAFAASASAQPAGRRNSTGASSIVEGSSTRDGLPRGLRRNRTKRVGGDGAHFVGSSKAARSAREGRAMLVATVLDMPELGLTVPSWSDAARPADLPDLRYRAARSGRFLSGGELVLTGLLWLRSDDDVPGFVAALADRGVAALVACDADTGVLPAALVAECERRGVPLLEAAVDLSFADVIERVGQVLAGERADGRQRGLMAAVARGAELPELLDAAGLAAPCRVLTSLGRVVAGPDLPFERIAVLVREWQRAGGRPVRVGTTTLLPVPGGDDVARWFLAVDGPVRERDLDELTGVIGVQRRRELESRPNVTETVLRVVLSGSAEMAQALGIDVRRPLRVLVASAPGGPPGRARAVLAEVAHDGVVGVVDEQVCALLSGELDVAVVARALRLLEPALAGGRLVVGISAPAAVRDLRGAAAEARYALELGERQRGRSRVVAGDEVAVHRLLLAAVPDELRTALRRRVLGPVLDHDAEHGGSLVATLRVFLDCSGSWSKAADQLHVHVNTLRYRIARVEQLAGIDLSDFTQRIDVYLALHA